MLFIARQNILVLPPRLRSVNKRKIKQTQKQSERTHAMELFLEITVKEEHKQQWTMFVYWLQR